jgi:hypothetical protein
MNNMFSASYDSLRLLAGLCVRSGAFCVLLMCLFVILFYWWVHFTLCCCDRVGSDVSRSDVTLAFIMGGGMTIVHTMLQV